MMDKVQKTKDSECCGQNSYDSTFLQAILKEQRSVVMKERYLSLI
jgi:hypothetical protein